MVVSDITNPHYFELIRGAEQRAKASEYTLVLVNAEESPRIEYDQIQRLVTSVDGFVLAASRLPDENLQQVASQRPVVLMNRELPGLASVVLDNEQEADRLARELAAATGERNACWRVSIGVELGRGPAAAASGAGRGAGPGGRDGQAQ